MHGECKQFMIHSSKVNLNLFVFTDIGQKGQDSGKQHQQGIQTGHTREQGKLCSVIHGNRVSYVVFYTGTG